MNDFLISFWTILVEMSPYLLLGFFFAGLLHAFVPQRIYARHLSKPGAQSVVKAALLGVPLPLCSCGVLPTTVALRRNGASRGASTAFLISTPQTGIDSIMATYALLGGVFALLRPIVALITGVLGGIFTDACFRGERESVMTEGQEATDERPSSFVARMRRALVYAYGELMQDVGRWLVIGLVVAALITVLVPADALTVLGQWPLLNMLLVLVVAVPMYICATGSIPIALSLILKGLTPGAAFVMLMAGPAVNAASMLVVSRVFGRKQTALYVLSIILGALAAGLFIDYVLPAEWLRVALSASGEGACHGRHVAWWETLSAAVLVILLLRGLVMRYFHHPACCSHCEGASQPCDDGETEPQDIVVNVEGMRCSHCAANVERAVKAVVGSATVEVELATGRVIVKGADNVTAEAVCEAINEAGYKAVVG